MKFSLLFKQNKIELSLVNAQKLFKSIVKNSIRH